MHRSPLRETPWYEHAFDSKYLRVYAHRGQAEADRATDLLIGLLGVSPGDRVLDVACGEGRYARALSRRGLRLTGIDLSRDLITEGRERGRLLPGSPLLVCLDARRLPYGRQFDGAISMFTSFGYFKTRAEDIAIFRGIARALVPGGRLVVDFLNEPQVRAGLVPEERREIDALRIEIRREIDEAADGGPRVNKHVRGSHRSSGTLELEFEESVRLYSGAEVDGLLEESGFVLLGEPMGGLDGGPAGAGAPRYIRAAEIPAS